MDSSWLLVTEVFIWWRQEKTTEPKWRPFLVSGEGQSGSVLAPQGQQSPILPQACSHCSMQPRISNLKTLCKLYCLLNPTTRKYIYIYIYSLEYRYSDYIEKEWEHPIRDGFILKCSCLKPLALFWNWISESKLLIFCCLFTSRIQNYANTSM